MLPTFTNKYFFSNTSCQILTGKNYSLSTVIKSKYNRLQGECSSSRGSSSCQKAVFSNFHKRESALRDFSSWFFQPAMCITNPPEQIRLVGPVQQKKDVLFWKAARFSYLNEAFCFACPGRYFAKTLCMGLLLCCHASFPEWSYSASTGTAHPPNDTQPRHACIYPFTKSSAIPKNKPVKRCEFTSFALPSELLLLTLSGT